VPLAVQVYVTLVALVVLQLKVWFCPATRGAGVRWTLRVGCAWADMATQTSSAMHHRKKVPQTAQRSRSKLLRSGVAVVLLIGPPPFVRCVYR